MTCLSWKTPVIPFTAADVKTSPYDLLPFFQTRGPIQDVRIGPRGRALYQIKIRKLSIYRQYWHLYCLTGNWGVLYSKNLVCSLLLITKKAFPVIAAHEPQSILNSPLKTKSESPFRAFRSRFTGDFDGCRLAGRHDEKLRSVELDLHVDPGCQIELHQRVDGLVSRVNNIHQPLMRSNFVLITCILVDMG